MLEQSELTEKDFPLTQRQSSHSYEVLLENWFTNNVMESALSVFILATKDNKRHRMKRKPSCPTPQQKNQVLAESGKK